MGSTKGHFEYGDLLEDVDAVNIGNIMKTVTQPLSSIVKLYYTNSTKSRYENFINLTFKSFDSKVNNSKTYEMIDDNILWTDLTSLFRLFCIKFEVPVLSDADKKVLVSGFTKKLLLIWKNGK